MDIERLKTKVGIECDREYFDRLHYDTWQEHVGLGEAIEQSHLDRLARGITLQAEQIFIQLMQGQDIGICEVLYDTKDDDVEDDDEIHTRIVTIKPDFTGVDEESAEEAEKFPTYAHFHIVMNTDHHTGLGIAYSLFVTDGYDFSPPETRNIDSFDPNINMDGKLAGLYTGDSDYSYTTPERLTQIIETNETLVSFCEIVGVRLPDHYFMNSRKQRAQNTVE